MTNTASASRHGWPQNLGKRKGEHGDTRDLDFIRLFDPSEPTEHRMYGLCGSCGEDGAAWRAIATDEEGNGLLVCGDCLELAAVMYCEYCEDALIEARGVVEWEDDRPQREWNACVPCRGHIHEEP